MYSQHPVLTAAFDQQIELLMFQLEQDKFKLKAELAKELAVEKMHQQMEQAKLEMEQSKLQLFKEGKLSAAELGRRSSFMSELPADDFDIVANLCRLPRFSDNDPGSFFSLLEHVADARGMARLSVHAHVAVRADGLCAGGLLFFN